MLIYTLYKYQFHKKAVIKIVIKIISRFITNYKYILDKKSLWARYIFISDVLHYMRYNSEWYK